MDHLRIHYTHKHPLIISQTVTNHRSSVIGLYTSYAVPIFLRITSGRNRMDPGPFHLGRWSVPVGTIAVAWVIFIITMLFFPPGETTTAEEMSRCAALSSRDVRTYISQITLLSSSGACSSLHQRRGSSPPESGSTVLSGILRTTTVQSGLVLRRRTKGCAAIRLLGLKVICAIPFKLPFLPRPAQG